MNALIDGAFSRARMVLSILVCVIIAGFATYKNLPKEAQPEIQVPFVGVTIPLEGISPEDAERLLVRPTEIELRSLEGLKEMSSFALEGAAQIVLEFELTADIDQALVDVREAVDMAKREFPEETREPVIEEINTALFPVLAINLYGDVPERGLYRIARNLKNELESVSGVLEANIQGEREEVLEIQVDPVKLETYNLSYEDIYNTVQANNRLIPAGRIDNGEGRFSIKVPGLIETAQDAFDLPVKRQGDRIVTLKDVAEIRRTFKDREVYAQFNGQAAVTIQVVKRSGANILETVDNVKALLKAQEAYWPDSLKVEITADQSEQIGDQLTQLESSIMTAIILVMIIVVGALGLRSALLVGVSIPASFLMGFLFLGLAGYTINMMVLFGLVIAVGILVDGAIVIVEYADRKMAEGCSPVEAYSTAGKRMFWPIIASNATTLAAFIPFLFWNSLPGKFMAYLPITLIFVIVSSMLMALIFLPVLGGLVGRRPEGKNEDLRALSGEDGHPTQAHGFIGWYARTISILIYRPLMVTGALLGICALVIVWFAITPHRTEFFLDAEPEQLYVFVGAQGNLSADEEFEIVRRVEELIAPIKGISSISTQSGAGSQSRSFGDGAGDIPLDTVGKILVDIDSTRVGIDGRKVAADIREALKDFVGGHIEVAELEEGPPTGKDIHVAIKSGDQQALLDVTSAISAKLHSMPELRDVEDTRPLPGIEWRLEIDRERAAEYGANVSTVGGIVQLVTNGILAGRYRPDDAVDEVDIRIRYPEEYRSVEAIDDLRLATPAGQAPISIFVDRYPAPRLDRIERSDGQRVFTVRANAVQQGEGAAITAQLKEWVAAQNFDQRVNIAFEGVDEDSAEAEAFFSAAAMGVLFMMGVILLWEFNNFYHVLLTLSAVIISTVGVLIGLQVAIHYVSILMTGTGIVALAGIVVNNNIVLIDTFQRLHTDGRSAHDAAVATAAQRMRPILLTTGTTICGLFPMMVQMSISFAEGTIGRGGPASEWWVPLSVAVVFGLGFSTFITLIVTPVWLAAPERFSVWKERVIDPRLARFRRRPLRAISAPINAHSLDETDEDQSSKAHTAA